MRILFVFTGGTIGSTLQGDLIQTDAGKPYALLKAYRCTYDIDFAHDTAAPFSMLSENSTGTHLRLLCEYVAQQLNKGYDGIVIMHGTDTLQYTAAALSYAFADVKIPLCLVSSNRPIELEGANGLCNLHGAIRFIREVGTPGVFVPYQNSGAPLCIHRGTRLLRSQSFTDRVESARGAVVGRFGEEGGFLPDPSYRERPNAIPAFGVAPLQEYCDSILFIEPRPGMTYPEIPARVRYILHGSYHSGTLNTESAQATSFFAKARARGIPVFLLAAESGAQYASTSVFGELGITPIPTLAPIAAYMKLWMWDALHPLECASGEVLQASLAGDVIP